MTDDYDPRKDGAESYNEAIKAIRMEKIKAGEIIPWKRKEVIGDCVLYQGDCLEVMQALEPVDLVLTDPPYGTTQCKWDAVIPLQQMWEAISRVAKQNAAIVLTCSQPFTSVLITSNIDQFRYSLVWDKIKGTGFLNARKMPMRNHEDIAVFYSSQPKFNPQKTAGHVKKSSYRAAHLQTDVYGDMTKDYFYESTERYPRSIKVFSTDTQNSSLHPTQKPVGLFEDLIKTYTDSGDVVLDFTIGSGTTLVACAKLGRKGIGIELDPDYFEIACERVRKAYEQPDFFVKQPSEPEMVQEDLL